MIVPFVGDTKVDTAYVSGEHPKFIIRRHRTILTVNSSLFIAVIFFSITVIDSVGEAGPTRFELATSCVTGRRSIQSELRPRIVNLPTHFLAVLRRSNPVLL